MNGGIKMKITKAWIKKHEPCKESIEWLEKQNTRDYSELYKILLNEGHLDWANWATVRFLSQRNKIKYAIYAVEQVLSIYENEYPTDFRPRGAIEAAKAVLKKRSKKTLAAARAAWTAAAAARAEALAESAALAASAAANAAASAAELAAASAAERAAALAAASAEASAAERAAERAAALAESVAAALAARAALMQKILNYGKRMTIKTQERMQTSARTTSTHAATSCPGLS